MIATEITPQAQSIKEKMDKLDVINIKNFSIEETEDEKTSHRLEENLYRTHVTEEWYPEFSKNS